jgi:hypothetical protein
MDNIRHHQLPDGNGDSTRSSLRGDRNEERRINENRRKRFVTRWMSASGCVPHRCHMAADLDECEGRSLQITTRVQLTFEPAITTRTIQQGLRTAHNRNNTRHGLHWIST